MRMVSMLMKTFDHSKLLWEDVFCDICVREAHIARDGDSPG